MLYTVRNISTQSFIIFSLNFEIKNIVFLSILAEEEGDALPSVYRKDQRGSRKLFFFISLLSISHKNPHFALFPLCLLLLLPTDLSILPLGGRKKALGVRRNMPESLRLFLLLQCSSNSASSSFSSFDV